VSLGQGCFLRLRIKEGDWKMYFKKITPIKQCTVAMGIVLNIVGAFIALNLRLPIYMDSIGTIMVSALLGPGYGITTGLLGSIISGITFDIYSLWYAPVQILTGLMAGILFKSTWLKGIKTPVGAVFLSFPTSIASAIITAFIFGGITSSASSYIVQMLSKLGVGLTLSCFLVQMMTDYADKFIGAVIVMGVLAAMPKALRIKIRGESYGEIQHHN